MFWQDYLITDNDAVAKSLRDRLSKEKTFLINLMSSPGAGKTSLILKTFESLKSEFRIGVIEADSDSMVDAEKVATQGVGKAPCGLFFCQELPSWVQRSVKW